VLLVSDKSVLAIRSLVSLVRCGGAQGPVAIAEVARSGEHVQTQIEQLFSQLKRGRILRSQRGVGGGYLLERAPDQITLLEIVELIDGPIGEGTDPLLAAPRDALRNSLARRTLDEIVREDEAAGAPMYYI